MSTDHKQVPIFDDGGEIFQVDENLQGLIQFLWDNEIDTFNSCQDNVHDTVWIEYDLIDWMRITTLAYDTEAFELLDFIYESCLIELTFQDDGHPDENDEFWIPGKNLIWGASVRFHKELLPDFELLIRNLLDDQ